MLVGALGALACSVALPGCRAGYVLRSAWFQAELLASREPVAEARQRPDLPEEIARGLDLVVDVKAFGLEIGLKPTEAYDTVALDWGRQLWNISASPPLAFEPRTWWFPIVGRVPYLGFFRAEDAEAARRRLEADGYEVYQRRIGTYSTLGWFGDPLLPGMLDGTAFEVARVVLHELAHATVWIPGSVSFNESFASFVGDEAALRYLRARHGPDAPELRTARDDLEDMFLWRRLQRALYERLRGVYQDPSLSEAEKLARKAALYEGFPSEVAAAPFHDPQPFVKSASSGTWNNARLIQFRTYNESRDAFEALLARNGGDLLAFMQEVRRVAGDGPDPFQALRRAAEATPTSR